VVPDAKTNQLVLQILLKADGVFSWVVMVVNTVRDGLINGNSLSELEDKIENLLVDLKELFRNIINSIDALDRTKTAQTLAILRLTETFIERMEGFPWFYKLSSYLQS
jgi:hypothetical protein